ncbi:MAG: S8 family serine peptidase [Burkholderiales bacterium]|nr:S8 family serine peptidase [Burkholderiales bacterium]
MTATLIRFAGVCAALASAAASANPQAAQGGIEAARAEVLSRLERVIPSQYVVKAQPSAARDTIDALARSLGGRIVGVIERRNLYLLDVPTVASGGAASAQTVLATLQSQRNVVQGAFSNTLFHIPEKMQPSWPIKAKTRGAAGALTPGEDGPNVQHATNDPFVGHQWHLAKISELNTSSGLGSSAPIVAVLDTGVAYDHMDLYGRVLLNDGYNFIDWNWWSYDYNGHGTHVAGIVSASSNNLEGVHGVCPDCTILPVKVLDDMGSGSWFSIMAGIDYADRTIDRLAGSTGARGVLNMSLGGVADPNSLEYIEMDALLDDVGANNKLIVVAAGNENDQTYVYCQYDPMNCGGFLTYIPAAIANALATGFSVGASDPNDYATSFTNTRSQYTNIIAPGIFIWSTTLSWPYYQAWGGTSMASPVVAGSAGRVWAQFPTLDAATVKTRIANNAITIGTNKGWPSGLRRIHLGKVFSTSTTPGFAGYVVNPESGGWDTGSAIYGPLQPVERVKITVKDSATGTVVKSGVTNKYGFFVIDGLNPSTSYSINYAKKGYAPRVQSVTTAANYVSAVDPVFLALKRVETAPFEDILVTLEWDSMYPYRAECVFGLEDCTDTVTRGAELDLFMRRPDGSVVSYANTGDIWGRLTRDSYYYDTPGEAVHIRDLMDFGAYTNYEIAVNRPYWGRMPTVRARVRVYRNGVQVATWTAPASCNSAATDAWWRVATIDRVTGGVTAINTCDDNAPF